jgi:hypothetical protein
MDVRRISPELIICDEITRRHIKGQAIKICYRVIHCLLADMIADYILIQVKNPGQLKQEHG